MPRYKIIMEYDGTGTVGWQRQKEGISIQGQVEDAIKEFTGKDIVIFAAGRTDAGVHATFQTAHFDTENEYRNDTVRDAINSYLYHKNANVVILKAEKVSDDFHARFDAKKRGYLYRINNRKPPIVLDRNRSWWIPVKLDVEKMNEAAQYLLGEHDFSSFRAAECQAKSPIRTVDKIEVTAFGSEIHINVEALSFIHHQVRNFVGTLKMVGTGKLKPIDVKTILEAKNRAAAGPTAPPYGLYLTKIEY